MEGISSPLISLLYADVFEHAPFGVYTLDAHGTINSFNPKMREISGDKVEDAIGLNALELESYKKAGLDQLFVRGLAGESFETEVEYRSHIGHRTSYRHYRGVPIPDKHIPGQARLLLIVEDITQRKRIENELKLEEARLRASINGLSMGCVLLDSRNQILMINQAAESILTLNTHTGFPSDFGDLTDATRPKIDFAFIESTLGRKAQLADQLAKSRDGRRSVELRDIAYAVLRLNLYLTPIITAGEVVGSVILIEDITERKVMERSRDEFFSIASHELRTPLTAIRGNTSLIQDYLIDSITSDEVKVMIADIHTASIRLIDIVSDFLDMSRLEQGRLQYKKESFDLLELVEDVMHEYDVTGLRKRVQLEIAKPDEPLPAVYADPDRVREIITNLVGNALKFTDQGKITVTFEKHEHQVKALVTDTGRGIPVESQTLLFRKFQQAQDNLLTRDASRGTGLGLYISRMMAQGMGGDVVLEHSEAGRGSVFSVTVPVATERAAAAPAQMPPQ